MAEYRKEKYYWFKLKDDFFKRHDIKIIKSMPNGKDYVIFYLQLLCESLSHNGKLRFNEEVPYNEEMLSVITDTNIDIVRSAMKLFVQLKIIEIMDDQTIYMTKLQNMVGSTTVGAEKKKLQRSKSIELLEGGQRVDICPPEIDKDKDLDTEIEKEKEEINNNKQTNKQASVDVAAIFKGIKDEVECAISPISFITFVEPMICKGVKGDRLIFSLPSMMADVIDQKFRDVFKAAIVNASNGELTDYVWEG